MISDSNPTPSDHGAGCGQQLRQARQAAGLSLEDVAARLRMPVQVIRTLESDNWQTLGAPVFVRGQLRSYARLLGIDLEPLLAQAPVAQVEPVKLVSHTHTPRLRRVMESTARRAVYVVMTCVLAIPVWYATRGHFGDNAPRTASLDVVPAQAPGADDGALAQEAGTERNVPATRQQTQPYIASMTPVPRAAEAAAPAPQSGGLSLRFNGDSWMRVNAPDGSQVEKALVRAGEQRSWHPGQVGTVLLGNASAVEVQQGGSIVDVKPFQRGNVARFAVSSDGSVVPASE